MSGVALSFFHRHRIARRSKKIESRKKGKSARKIGVAIGVSPLITNAKNWTKQVKTISEEAARKLTFLRLIPFHIAPPGRQKTKRLLLPIYQCNILNLRLVSSVQSPYHKIAVTFFINFSSNHQTTFSSTINRQILSFVFDQIKKNKLLF